MTYNEAFFTLLLASRLVAAAYVTAPIERDTADDNQYVNIEPIEARVRNAVEDSTPSFTYDPQASYTYDPMVSYTYDPQPSYTYDPQPTYTYDPPAKRAEADHVPVGIEDMK